jgi:hypothetical protein
MSGESWEVKAKRFGEKYPRLVGAAMTLVGGAVCYWLIAVPIQQATAHAREVSFQGKATICAVMVTVIGLLVTVFGSSVKGYLESNPTRSKALGITIVAIAAVIGVAVSLWTRNYLETLGYTFR